MNITDNPFLPLTIRRATFHPKPPPPPEPTVGIRSYLHQSDRTNQQVMNRPISQIIRK